MRISTIITLLFPLFVATSAPATAQPCPSQNGATTRETLVDRVLQTLAGTDPAAMKLLAVDECAWRRAQWLLGVDRAERLAEVVRGDRLPGRHAMLQKDLKKVGGTHPFVVKSIDFKKENKVRVAVDGPERPFRLSFELIEIDGRWYLSDDDIDIRVGDSGVFMRADKALDALATALAALNDVAPARTQPTRVAVFEAWKKANGDVAATLATLPKGAEDETRDLMTSVYAAFAAFTDAERREPAVAETLRGLGTALGVTWNFQAPTGDADCDRHLQRALKCAKTVARQQDAYREGITLARSATAFSVSCKKLVEALPKDPCAP